LKSAEKTKLMPIRLPERVLRELKEHVKRGKRSEFVVKATEKALTELKQAKALKEYRGIFTAGQYPEFATPDATRAWVEAIRKEADERMKRDLEGN